MSIAFIDLAAQQRRIRGRLDAAIAKVLDHGGYVMGPEVRQFEAELAAFGQAPLALSCANGTDALALPLMAWGIGEGDAVFCPSFTFTATPEVMPWVGATPVFVDVLPDTFNLDPAKLEAAIAGIKVLEMANFLAGPVGAMAAGTRATLRLPRQLLGRAARAAAIGVVPESAAAPQAAADLAGLRTAGVIRRSAVAEVVRAGLLAIFIRAAIARGDPLRGAGLAGQVTVIVLAPTVVNAVRVQVPAAIVPVQISDPPLTVIVTLPDGVVGAAGRPTAVYLTTTGAPYTLGS